MIARKLAFFLCDLDNKFLCCKTLHQPRLGLLAVELFLNCIYVLSSLDLQTGVVSTVWNGLSENRCGM